MNKHCFRQITLMKLRYSGINSSQLSMMKTRLTYNLILFFCFLFSNKSKGALLGINKSARNSSCPSTLKIDGKIVNSKYHYNISTIKKICNQFEVHIKNWVETVEILKGGSEIEPRVVSVTYNSWKFVAEISNLHELQIKTTEVFISDGFFRILEKTSFELICTRMYF